jgi:hypothetical protein
MITPRTIFARLPRAAWVILAAGALVALLNLAGLGAPGGPWARIAPQLERCSADLQTVRATLQAATARWASGNPDPGTLGPDADAMHGSCLAATQALYTLNVDAAHRTARSQLYLAFANLVTVATDYSIMAQDLQTGDTEGAARVSNLAGTAIQTALNDLRRAGDSLGVPLE